MANPVYESLSKSLACEDFSNTLEKLSEAAHFLEIWKNPSELIDLEVVIMIEKITSHFQHKIFLPIGKLYLKMIQIPNLQESVTIPLCNDIYSLSDRIKGTGLSQKLVAEVKNSLENFQISELDPEQAATIVELLGLYKQNVTDEDFKQALQEISEGKVHGMNNLVETLSTFDDVTTQYTVFIEKIENVIEEIEKQTNPELVSRLLDILEIFVYQRYFKVKINETSQLYKLEDFEIPSSLVLIYIRALQITVLYEVQISQRIVILLQRL